jgi:uncharacterized paraquat-inducible protein A
MIQITLAHLFYIYLLTWFVVLILLWTRELWRHKAYDWELSKDQLCLCEHCHYSFLVKNNKNITRCPNCNGICIANKRRRL